MQPDARVAVTRRGMSALLGGQITADAPFSHVSGDTRTTDRLTAVFSSPA